jgi:hypothetical protein
MSSLSYNPNIDIPAYHDIPQQMMQSYSNNMQQHSNNGMMPQYSNGMMQQNNMQSPMMPQYSNGMMQQPPMMPMIQQQPQMMSYPIPMTKNKKQKNPDQFTNIQEGKKTSWGVYIKKLIIFTILFLVISHVKTNDLIEKIPLVGSNEIFMMVVKGFIMAIIIIIVDKILG